MTTPSTTSPHGHDREEEGETLPSGWSNLPDELVHAILACLCSIVDFTAFKSVCRSWRTIASSISPSQASSLFPPLLLLPNPSYLENTFNLRVLDPANPSFYSFCSLSPNMLSFDSFYTYSPLVLLSDKQNCVLLFNPLTQNDICSPHLPLGYDISDISILLITSPHASPGSEIFLKTYNSLIYWRIGSRSWSSWYFPKGFLLFETTVVTVKEKIYAMDSVHGLCEINLSPQLHLKPLSVEKIGIQSFGFEHLLVDCGGELLHLLFVPTGGFLHEQGQLMAFRLDLSENKAKWVKQETLGNWAIFVAYSRQLPAFAAENPERWGGRSNCVYFPTENAIYGGSPWVAMKLGDVAYTRDPKSPLYRHNFGCKVNMSFAWVHPGF